MAVQLNSYQHLPLTITPVLHNTQSTVTAPAAVSNVLRQQSLKPELTFHCICCKTCFMNPFDLYKHMSNQHSSLPEKQTNGPEIVPELDNENDYSWIFEPICELLIEDTDSDSDSDKSNSEDSSSNSSDDDDDDDDDDDGDGDDSSSSSGSSSITSSTSVTTNSNSNTQHSVNQLPLPEFQNVDETADVEVAATNSDSNSAQVLMQPDEMKLKLADTGESTSIIYLQPSTAPSLEPAVVTITPVNQPIVPAAMTIINNETVEQPIKRRRGRRSMATPMNALASTNEQKCFQCSHCEASFPNAGDLSKHVRSHITNKPFQCSICQKTFTHIGSLNTHIRIHSGEKPYKCELCAKAFTQSSSLMVHVRSHSVRKPFQCHKCDKGFTNQSSLLMHQKTHYLKAESYVCPECDKDFKQEALLDEHMRMHTQELVYQCSICRQAFRSSSELVQHMKCHMGEKPFTCSICDRSFTQSGSLNIHMRIHTGEKPFHCKLCEKSFTQASSLSVHMKIHTGEKPFPCHVCGKSYSQQAYLNKHIQAHFTDQLQIQAPKIKPTETLLCIVCGSLHNDRVSLARHVTQQHAALLDKMQYDSQMQDVVKNSKMIGFDNQMDQLAYVEHLKSVLQHVQAEQLMQPINEPVLKTERASDEDDDDVHCEPESEVESSFADEEDEDKEQYYDQYFTPYMEVGYEEEIIEDYAAEEEVYTEAN